MSRESLELEKLQLEVAEASIAMERTEYEFKMDKVWRKNDILHSHQEVVRRGIETIMGVLRVDPRSEAIGKPTRTKAEAKLNEFLDALKPGTPSIPE